DVTSLVLVPAIRQVTDLPIIATGGFGTGGGLVAALALGADAVAMGTRFATSRESPVHPRTKDLILAKEVTDTLYNSNFDTMPCRVMKTPTSQKRMAKKLTLWRALWRALGAARESGRPLPGLIGEVLRNGFAQTLKLAYFGAATTEIRRAIVDGDHDRGIQLIGQVQGLLHDIPAVADIMQRTLTEADTALAQVSAQLVPAATGASSRPTGPGAAPAASRPSLA
ncbi:MAG: nitronate monooxygenase, partial [Pseudomonadota bacterium]